MKRFLLRLLGLMLVAGALAPVGVRQYRLWRDDQAARAYFDAVDALDDIECGALRSMALRYDATLADVAPDDPFSSGTRAEVDQAYADLLDPAGNGVMAVLEVPKLGATLPVYHGAARVASGEGVGHLEGSGLPVDGADGACVLAARGSGWLYGPYAGLDRLLPGDIFTIHSLRDELTYEVTRVSTALAEALAEGYDDAQACVLMTAAGRDKRLCVTARRVERRDIVPRDDSQAVAAWPSRLIFAAPVALVGLILIGLVEGVRRFARRRRTKRLRL